MNNFISFIFQTICKYKCKTKKSIFFIIFLELNRFKIFKNFINNYKITDIKEKGSGWIINDSIECDIIINTAPWKSFKGILKDDVFIKNVDTLKNNSKLFQRYG